MATIVKPGQVAKRVNPEALRQQAAQQLRALLSQYDIAEFQAQTHAAAMIDLLANFAYDVTLPGDPLEVARFRADMAMRVLDRAYGKPAEKQYLKVEDNRAPEDKTVTVEIETVRQAVTEFRQMDQYFHLPPDQWPEWLRRRVSGGAELAPESERSAPSAEGQGCANRVSGAPSAEPGDGEENDPGAQKGS